MKRIIRFLEFGLLFIAMPVAFYYEVLPVPKIAALVVVALSCLFVLWRDNSYDLKNLFNIPGETGVAKGLIWEGGLVALVLIIFVLILQPEELFIFPHKQPLTWVMVMILYPFLSALPQEFLYREYFFHRYGRLFKNEWLLMLMSALSFSFLHIIYDNLWAIILSFIGGLIFAQTYRSTRSLCWVSLEHAVYGCLVFTIGLGNYFYEGF